MGGSEVDADPLFIVGAPRSGTTLVRAMLAASPTIAIPPESHFLSYLYKRYAGKLNRWTPALSRQLALDISHDGHFEHWGLDPGATVERVLARKPATFAATVAGFFSIYASDEGKTRWGDKTPHYIFFHRELAGLFPRLRVIHLIRDGRDVACSHLALAREQHETWVAQSAPAAAAWWKASIHAGYEAAEGLGPRYREVKYETLVDAPEKTLRDLCAFAGLEYDDRMVQYGEHVHIPRDSPYGRPFERVQGGLQGRARDWRTELTPSEIADFEAVGGAELTACGYVLSGLAWNERRRWLARVRGKLFMTSRDGGILIRHVGHRYAAGLVRRRNRLRSGWSKPREIPERRPS
jgi:hypothetical protein